MQFLKNLKHILFVSIFTLAIIFAGVNFFGPGLTQPITHFLVYRENVPLLNLIHRHHFTPSEDIVLIKISENSLNNLAAVQNDIDLSLGKDVYRDLANNLFFAQARGVGFDIVFQNRDPQYEYSFASTLEANKNIIIATARNTEKCVPDAGGQELTCEGIPRSVYARSEWGLIMMGDGVHDAYNNDRRILVTDLTGLNERYGSLSGSREVYTLPIALFRQAFGTGKIDVKKDSVGLNPFYGGEGSYREYDLSDVRLMSRQDLIKNFAGKFVLIGTHGSLFQDMHISPVTGELMDGVDFHAHFLNGILENRILKEYTIRDFTYFIGLILLTMIMCIVYLYGGKYLAIGAMIGFTLFLIWIGRYIYFTDAIVLQMFPLLFAGSLLTFPNAFIYRFFILDREKRMLTKAFSHYVDPEVVKQISANAEHINLGGESKPLTILFSDIAGFTTLSETLKPSDLFFLMSSYLSKMTDILTKNGGTLDKYIGDAVMGFFGAPISQSDHARRACMTALEMRKALPRFNQEIISRGLEAIDFRVGIGSGEVLVGNIGSHDRFNYTVLGDTVNLASRLEAISKEYGTHIIVSEGTYELVKTAFLLRKLDLITVKGKNQPVAIYELIDDINVHDREVDLICRNYDEALKYYLSGKYVEAGKIWEKQMKNDPPSQAMTLRCLEILKGNITIENGVYHMTKK